MKLFKSCVPYPSNIRAIRQKDKYERYEIFKLLLNVCELFVLNSIAKTCTIKPDVTLCNTPPSSASLQRQTFKDLIKSLTKTIVQSKGHNRVLNQ